ncbi:MAG: putative 4-hydroxybenzoate polyprenyltransferase [Phycisphaerales bacterium]|nr:putative 4-hydroxybenzoate polyprenyltransferase [Phycisphaerales bacterium]
MSTARVWGEMIKFSHSLFALPFAVLATFLAARPELPGLAQFGLIVWCMIAARSAAMTFNRLIDHPIDARNPRTAMRALPAGTISRGAAWAFFLAACLAFVAGCAGFWWLDNNIWPVALSAPVLGFLCFYSLTKRFTRWSHLVLGAAIAFAPVAAWIAISPLTLGAPAWLLMAAVTLWIAGFDTIYACQDVGFDTLAGLHSLPARIGIGAALWLARAFHAITVILLLLVGITAGLGAIYYAGVVVVGLLLAYENSIVRANDLSRVNLAFFTVNGIVGVVLGLLGVVDILLAARL